MKANIIFTLIFLSALTHFNIEAQVTADFSVDYSSGCSPLTVNFTNLSTGSGTLTYTWDLGNGNTSTLKDPKAVYSTAATYTVKLTATNGTQTSTKQKTITVFKSPVANFSANNKGCTPFIAQFTDGSTQGDAAITSWNWDFRNGVTKTEKNPSFTYTDAGKFTVFLEVTDANNCKASIEKKNYIDLVNKPEVSFYATPSTSCKIPATVQFTNQSTGGGLLTYLWNFGGTNTSTEQNPKFTYTQFGQYNVKLTVTSDYGCSSYLDIPAVTIGQVDAVGTIKQGTSTILNNGIICAGDIQYASQSTGNPNCMWDFGDGTYAYTSTGMHTYNSPGNFKIKLIAAPGDNCADTAIWNVTVEKVTANFNMSPQTSCESSVPVTFTDASTSAVSYLWQFSDGTTATTKNANKTFTVPADKDQYVVHSDAEFPVSLTATSQNGCKSTSDQVFVISRPTALFAPSTVKGCAPLTLTLSDKSISNDLITTYDWTYGDGATLSTSQANVSHTYTTAGTYQAKLAITNQKGCKDESYIINIEVGSTPAPDFDITPASYCPSLPLQITDKTPAGNNIDRWHYTVGGIGIASCPDVASPDFRIKAATGNLPVKQIVESNGCFAEVTKANAINNTGPTASFNYSTNCGTTRSVTFTGSLVNQTSFKWDFGDGQTNTTDATTPHIYSTEGDYTVKLIAINGSCSDTAIRMVKVRNHQPAFKSKTEFCADATVYFNSKASHTIANSGIDKYLWNFGDTTQNIRTSKDSVAHSFKNGGTFPVKLYAYYDDGCIDSVTNNVRVYKPKVLFSADKSVGCAPLISTMTDLSTPDVHPIIYWNWQFGDGYDTSYTAKKNTFWHNFQVPGTFSTSLTISDDFGCSATYAKEFGTANPSADFMATTPAQICSNTKVSFDYLDSNLDSAVWDFGDGTKLRSLAKPTEHLYKNAGNYAVSLLVYKYGCSDQLIQAADYIQVQKADARFTASDTVYNCYPHLITFNHTTGGQNISSGKWYYGQSNSTSTGYVTTTNFNYTEPGKYRAKLELQTTFGCVDTFSRLIAISGPTGTFSASPLSLCKGDEVTLTLADTSNVFKFEWDLGDGSFSTANPVKHRYGSTGNKTCKLVLYGDYGKCIPPAIEQSVHVYEVDAKFTVADTSVCENENVTFENKSSGANAYNWDFGDGGTSNSSGSAVHGFNSGTYLVKLIVSSTEGCKDTARQAMVINKYPSLTINKDTSLCLGKSLNLVATTNSNAIRWEPATGLDFQYSRTPVATPTVTTRYRAIAIDTVSKCEKRDSLLITVQQKPDVKIQILDQLPSDSTIILGREIHLLVETEAEATFLWTPSNSLSCSTCADPIAQPLENTHYILQVIDKNHCFNINKDLILKTKEADSPFDLPTAFTPQGDEQNRIFKIQGYDVEEVLEFRIFNRWGNMVFSTTNKNEGWDGTYKGKLQPIDSYIYTVKVKTTKGEIITKKGTVLLLQ